MTTDRISEERLRTIYAYPGLIYDLEIRQLVDAYRRSSPDREMVARKDLPDAIDIYRLLKAQKLRSRRDIAKAIAAALGTRS